MIADCEAVATPETCPAKCNAAIEQVHCLCIEGTALDFTGPLASFRIVSFFYSAAAFKEYMLADDDISVFTLACDAEFDAAAPDDASCAAHVAENTIELEVIYEPNDGEELTGSAADMALGIASIVAVAITASLA